MEALEIIRNLTSADPESFVKGDPTMTLMTGERIQNH